jgi:titin
VTTNNTTYTFRATVAQLSGGTPVNITVQTVARANRVPGQTVFGSTTSVESGPYTLQATGPAAPATPTGLAATISAAGAVTLNWTAVAPAAGTTITYLVSVDSGTAVAMARGATITPALALGVSHTVTVIARATSLGLSTDSVAAAPVTVDLSAPVAPATLTVSATALNWAAATVVPAGATVTYVVQKSVNAGSTWVDIIGSPFTARTAAIASPVGTNYQYRVAAVATPYGSLPTAQSIWRTTTFNTLPAASTRPTAIAGAVGSKQIAVTWTNASNNLTGFTLARRLGGGAWVNTPATLATVTKSGTNTYSFTDTVPAAGTYTYRVLATSAAGNTANTAASNAVIAP